MQCPEDEHTAGYPARSAPPTGHSWHVYPFTHLLQPKQGMNFMRPVVIDVLYSAVIAATCVGETGAPSTVRKKPSAGLQSIAIVADPPPSLTPSAGQDAHSTLIVELQLHTSKVFRPHCPQLKQPSVVWPSSPFDLKEYRGHPTHAPALLSPQPVRYLPGSHVLHLLHI